MTAVGVEPSTENNGRGTIMPPSPKVASVFSADWSGGPAQTRTGDLYRVKVAYATTCKSGRWKQGGCGRETAL